MIANPNEYDSINAIKSRLSIRGYLSVNHKCLNIVLIPYRKVKKFKKCTAVHFKRPRSFFSADFCYQI